MSFVLRAVLLGLLHAHCGQARVLTEVPSGPLYRVVGQPLRILCNVSGFEDAERQKDFQFRLHLENKPEVNIISTEEPDFSFRMFADRVQSAEITLEKLTPNSALFTVARVTTGDEGLFECAVVNYEGSYMGVYFAEILVKVIDDTLAVSSTSTPLNLDEGEPLTLTCQASSNTVQHTHLSVAWYLHTEEEEPAHPIVSLDRDLALAPGPRFEERYRDGAVRMDKVGADTYRLHLARVALSDQGRVYCRAQEWIQEPDRSWYSLVQKDSESSTLKVQAKDTTEVAPASLLVAVSVEKESLQEGQEVALTCTVDRLAPGELFSVAWLRNGSELARFGPTGVLQVGQQYLGRHAGGELTATKTAARVHALVLRPVGLQDQGGYLCRAWPQHPGPGGGFTQGQAQDSGIKVVSISATASGLSVQVGAERVAVTERGTLQLNCSATGFTGRLSVAWEHDAGSGFRTVVDLSPEGVLGVGQGFAGRSVRAARPSPSVFTLELDEVQPTDEGGYQCTVTERAAQPSGGVDKSHSEARKCTVTVASLETALKLSLKSRKNQATVGEDVELLCRLKGIRIPVTLIWTLRPDGSTSADKLLELSADGAVAWWGSRKHRYQLKVERNGEMELVHTLLISGATLGEAGRYRCEASVFLEGRHKKVGSSNELAVGVKKPESQLKLRSAEQVAAVVNDDMTVRCSVEKSTPGAARYAVTWLEGGTNRIVVASGLQGMVTYGAPATPGDEQRISMLQQEGPSFLLTIRRALVGDSGVYSCVVVEWLQDPNGNWFDLPPLQTSTTVQISETANDLQVDKEERRLVVREGQDVDLDCLLTSGAAQPALTYPVTWYYTAPSLAKNFTLAELSVGGLLIRPQNPELGQDPGARFWPSRPAHDTFRLGVLGAQQGDSGTYWCQVQQFQLNRQGRWEQRTMDTSGPLVLIVEALESHLSIGVGRDVNVTEGLSSNFTLPCTVTAQSGSASTFQVTWFRQGETGGPARPLFTAYPNATLRDHSGMGNRLRFLHPEPGLYSLTVSLAVPEDSGLYHCQVEEWLLTPYPRKVGAVERSEEISVEVRADLGGRTDAAADARRRVGILYGVVACLSLLLLLVLGALVRALRRGPGPRAKKELSLWEERHPLESKPALDGATVVEEETS